MREVGGTGSCAGRFRHCPYAGRLLEDAVKDLIEQKTDAARDTWWTLDVIERGGHLIFVDNGRLWCLHEFQRRVPSHTVFAKLRLKVWDPLFDRFLSHLDSRHVNVDINVRC